jgi:hypothetical protein
MLFKFLVSLHLLMACPSVMDEEGWVLIERPHIEEEALGADERDPSIWVAFAKQVGPEKILINFPDEPVYHYGQGDEMEVFLTSNETEYRLQIATQIFHSSDEMLRFRLEQLGHASVIQQKIKEKSVELLVWKDGFWLQEKLIRTDLHTFLIQVKSTSIDRDSYKTFARSFDLVLDPKFSESY